MEDVTYGIDQRADTTTVLYGTVRRRRQPEKKKRRKTVNKIATGKRQGYRRDTATGERQGIEVASTTVMSDVDRDSAKQGVALGERQSTRR
jgi:hypothetical protein